MFKVRALESSSTAELAFRVQRKYLHFIFFLSLLAWAVGLAGVGRSFAQEETTRGKIAGTVRNQAGAPIPGAKVRISSRFRDVRYDLVTDKDGHYESTWLQEANDFVVRMEARDYRMAQFVVTVKVGQTTNGDRKLQPINPGKPILTSTVNMDQIAALPVDGREAVNATKFETGVQVEDGGSIEPTKAGNFAAAIDKLSGLDTRNTLDGVDYTDETKGGVMQNIAIGSVSEAVVTRSMRDVSEGLSSSGILALTTHSGGEAYHGEGFGFFRDSGVGFANSPGGVDPHYQRSDFGGKFGGKLLSDKFFFFVDAERQHQDARQAVVTPTPFQALTGGFSSPFRNTAASGRLDWKASENTHAFYRFAYNLNTSIDNFGQGYSIYDNRSNAPSHAVGLDLTRGEYTHSIRFGYLHYHNSLQGVNSGVAVIPQSNVNVRFSDLYGGAVQFGPSTVAPQETFQSNKEVRYDLTHPHGNYIVHLGGSFNRIMAGGYQNSYGLGPQITSAVGTGVDPNVGDYPVLSAALSNGQGFATEKSGFGLPHGGVDDWRLQAYIGVLLRVRPNITVTLGTNYVRDTGRTDSDLAPVECASIVGSLPAGTSPCTGTQNIFDQFGFIHGQGAQVRTPGINFGPQFGIAWDPYHNGRTVIRGGGAVFYDTALFSNVRYDRSLRLAQGLFSGTNVLSCSRGAAPGTIAVNFPTATGFSPVTSIDGLDLATQVCGQPIGAVAGNIADLQSAYQAAFAGAGGNPNFVGRSLAISTPFNNLAGFQSNYQTPRSYQMSIGLQRELWPGGTLSADYVRNVSQRFALIQDTNHVGDQNFLNTTAALSAITRTLAEKAPGCLALFPIITAGAISQAATNCYISAVPGASINDFAVNGLDSGVAYLGGLPVSVARGVGQNLGAAFAGTNPLVGEGMFMTSEGQAVYNGGQVEFKQNMGRVYSAFRNESMQVSYSFSKFVSSGGDNFGGSALAYDFQQAAAYKGPSPLDRRHQISFAGTLETRWGPRILFAGRFASPAPSVLTMAVPSGNPLATPGEIFRTDFRGDGTPGDIFPPKINAGSFEPPSGSGVSSAISTYNSTQAGQITPAGLALVTAQILTASQLATLHGVKPFVVLPPTDQASNPWFKSFDTAVTWPLKVRESLLIEPRVSLYNVFNIANFAPLSGQLTYYFPSAFQPLSGGIGAANGTPNGPARDGLRTNFGTGMYNAGAPRELEFGVKVTF